MYILFGPAMAALVVIAVIPRLLNYFSLLPARRGSWERGTLSALGPLSLPDLEGAGRGRRGQAKSGLIFL